VPYTRAGCSVGEIAAANQELENAKLRQPEGGPRLELEAAEFRDTPIANAPAQIQSCQAAVQSAQQLAASS